MLKERSDNEDRRIKASLLQTIALILRGEGHDVGQHFPFLAISLTNRDAHEVISFYWFTKTLSPSTTTKTISMIAAPMYNRHVLSRRVTVCCSWSASTVSGIAVIEGRLAIIS